MKSIKKTDQKKPKIETVVVCEEVDDNSSDDNGSIDIPVSASAQASKLINEDEYRSKYETKKRKLEENIINEIFNKCVTEIFSFNENSILQNKFKCKKFSCENHHHDFGGIVANVHEINISMVGKRNNTIRFNYCDNSDDNESCTSTDIFINNKTVYHHSESHGDYHDSSAESDTGDDSDDDSKKICNDDELDALKIFFDKIKLIF